MIRYCLNFNKAIIENAVQAKKIKLTKIEFKLVRNSKEAMPVGTILYSTYLSYSPKKEREGSEIISEIKMFTKAQKRNFVSMSFLKMIPTFP